MSKLIGSTLIIVASLLIQIVVAADPDPKPATVKFEYEISVTTGRLENAGTDSNIFIILTGEKGESPEISLNSLIEGNAFEKGATDQAKISLDTDLGPIIKISVRSDQMNEKPEWFLSYITAAGPNDGGNTFDFNTWFKDKEPKVRKKAPK